MAIESFIRVRAELRMIENDVEKILAQAKEIHNENQRLNALVDDLQQQLKKYENDTRTNDSCSCKSNDNEN